MVDPLELEAVLAALRADEPCHRYEAAILLGTPEFSGLAPRVEMVWHLVPLLDDEHDHVRYYTAVSLGNLGFDEAVEHLVRRLNTERTSWTASLNVVAAIEAAIEKLRGAPSL